jgi:8-oxo-dGTP diphosphatase
VIREVREETTAPVSVGELLFVYEYVPRLEDNRYADRPIVRPVFRCTLHPGSEPRLPYVPDEFQIGVQWIALDELETIPLIPQIGALIRDAIRRPNPRDPFLPAGSEYR